MVLQLAFRRYERGTTIITSNRASPKRIYSPRPVQRGAEIAGRAGGSPISGHG
jgi:hypothetical protein